MIFSHIFPTFADKFSKKALTMKNFIDELTWRGMIHQMMPGTDELLKTEQVTAYLGRISGPLLDRFDLHVDVDPVAKIVWADGTGEPS